MYFVYVTSFTDTKHPNNGLVNGRWITDDEGLYKFIDEARILYRISLSHIRVLKEVKISSTVSYRLE